MTEQRKIELLHYSICHNDDSPADQNHRRVALTLYRVATGNDRGWWLKSAELNSEIVFMGTRKNEAIANLLHVYDLEYWDLKPAA